MIKLKVGDFIEDRYDNIAKILNISYNQVRYLCLFNQKELIRPYHIIKTSLKNGDFKILKGYETPLYKTLNDE